MKYDTAERATTVKRVPDPQAGRWLLLIHQIPPKPAYFRVKIWRRLQAVGAVAVKNSVYVLPHTEDTMEDFQWIAREIRDGGGEASLCEASFVEGLTDEEIRALFARARDDEYGQVADEAAAVLKTYARDVSLTSERRAELAAHAGRLQRQLAQVNAIDFFGASKHELAAARVSDVAARLRAPRSREPGPAGNRRRAQRLVDRTWVTRADVHVDRIASAWLIKRFIDPGARFKFVRARDYKPEPGELRFDMFDAEFTHEGDRCTFEVLLQHGRLKADRALRHIAEIVHDLDLKDGKFERDEAAGIARLIAGLVNAHASDEPRFARGAALFDDLYESFRKARRQR
jgi:hypothetical protein